MKLKFRHKILLSACGVVVLAFALFTLYNDYLQRNTLRQNIEASVQQAGALTASSVQNWMSGRILVLENLAQDIATQGPGDTLGGLIEQPSYTRNFLFTYLARPMARSPSAPTRRCPPVTIRASGPGTPAPRVPGRPCSPRLTRVRSVA